MNNLGLAADGTSAKVFAAVPATAKREMTDQHGTFTADPPDTGPPIPELIGSGPAMQQVYRLVRQVAPFGASVLLLGEIGTGKQLIARAIHQLSPRSSGPFVRVNCGATAEDLLEGELFGYVRGWLGRAADQRSGRFEAAHAGTIFLAEIDAAPPRLQAKLLRVLQEHEFERVGDTHTICVDARVIAASSRDLWEEVEAGRFREDLYHQLSVVTVSLPPLRQRREDVAGLVAHFLKIYSQQNDRPLLRPRQEAIDALEAYDWPGNVGQLQSCMERAVVLAPGDEFTCDLLPEAVLGGKPRRLGRGHATDLASLASELVEQGITTAGPQAQDLHAAIVNQVERELIAQVMTACEGVQTKAAARLGINRNTLHKKLKQYGLEK
jgi:DNA-binding NtrC family response regulator